MENSIELASASQLVSNETTSTALAGGAVPDGEYVAKVHDVSHYTGDAGKLILDIEFRVTDGVHAGRAVFETLTLDTMKADPLRGPWYRLGVIAAASGVPTPVSDPLRQLREGRPLRLIVEGGRPRTYAPIVAHSPQHVRGEPALAPTTAMPSITPVAARPSVVAVPDFALKPPGILGDITRWVTASAQRPQPRLSPLSALAFCAAVMGNMWRGPTGLSSNLYLTGVCGSGGGKDHILRSPKTLLQACGLTDLLGGVDIASGPGLIARLVERPNTFYALDEWGHYLRAMADPKNGSHLREVAKYMLQLSGPLHPVFGGKDYANRTDATRKTAAYPCLNLLGITTPDTYYGALTLDQVKDGFLGRMIVVESDVVPPKTKRPESADAPAAVIEWARTLRNAANISPMQQASLAGCAPSSPRIVQYADAAAESILDEFDDFADEERARLAVDGDGFDNLVVRWHEQALKLALIAGAALSPVEPAITIEAARWACEFVRYNGGHAVRAARDRVVGSEFERKVRACVSALRRAGAQGLSQTDMARNSRAFNSLLLRERRDMVGHLEESGEAIPASDGIRMKWFHPDFVPKP